MVTGSAPIQSDILDFLKVVLCCRINEAWGMTENAAPGCLTHVDDPESGHVGAPMPNMEFRLANIPEMGYFITNANP